MIVLGMHRSGTSLLTELLRGMGVFMGADLEENKESRFFIGINEWLLHQAGVSWQDPRSFRYVSNDFRSLMAGIIRLRLQSGHSSKYLGKRRKSDSILSQDTFWGWKDPRNTFTWAVWKELFPEAHLVHVLRNPVDVCRSLVKRENEFISANSSPLRKRTGLRKIYLAHQFPRKRLMHHPWRAANLAGAYEMWKDYVSMAVSMEKDKPGRILHVKYEDLLQFPDEKIAAIASFAGANVNSSQLTDLTGLIKRGRQYAFVGSPEHESFYNEIKGDPLVIELGYQDILNGP